MDESAPPVILNQPEETTTLRRNPLSEEEIRQFKKFRGPMKTWIEMDYSLFPDLININPLIDRSKEEIETMGECVFKSQNELVDLFGKEGCLRKGNVQTGILNYHCKDKTCGMSVRCKPYEFDTESGRSIYLIQMACEDIDYHKVSSIEMYLYTVCSYITTPMSLCYFFNLCVIFF